MMILSKVILQHIWRIIHSIDNTEIANLDDAAVVNYIKNKLTRETTVTELESCYTNEYIQSRLSLIRDLAEVRSSRD
ncbi:MAG: hypothetical protein AAGE84_29450 [Cyanobacteria bacterium P01_G01_bin.39]